MYLQAEHLVSELSMGCLFQITGDVDNILNRKEIVKSYRAYDDMHVHFWIMYSKKI